MMPYLSVTANQTEGVFPRGSLVSRAFHGWCDEFASSCDVSPNRTLESKSQKSIRLQNKLLPLRSKNEARELDQEWVLFLRNRSYKGK